MSEDYLATGSEGGGMLSRSSSMGACASLDDVEQARGLYEQALAEA